MSWRTEAVQLVKQFGCKSVAEIGIWKGELSRMLYPLVDRLVLVDPLAVANIEFETENTKTSEVEQYSCRMNETLKTQEELDQIHNSIVNDMPNAEVYRMTSLEAAKEIKDASLDLVYIDAVHLYSFVRQDIEAWLPKVKPGGIIAGDDYNLHYVGLAVNELIEDVQNIGPRTSRNRSPRTWYKKV